MTSKPARNMQKLIYERNWKYNSASCWFLLYGYVTMYSEQNIKNSNLKFGYNITTTNKQTTTPTTIKLL